MCSRSFPIGLRNRPIPADIVKDYRTKLPTKGRTPTKRHPMDDGCTGFRLVDPLVAQLLLFFFRELSYAGVLNLAPVPEIQTWLSQDRGWLMLGFVVRRRKKD
jgi:hypothetical protein